MDAEYIVLDDASDDQLERVIRRYWWAFRKRLGFLIGVVLIPVALTVLHDSMAPRRYTAESKVLIQSTAPKIFGHDSAEGGLASDTDSDNPQFQSTEYELLRSRSLAAKVVDAEHLRNNSAFAGSLRQVTGKGSDGKATGDQGLIDAYMSGLKVTPVEDTALVRIGFTTSDPELSARLANAHVREFIRQRIELNAHASEEAERFLEQKMVELKRQVEESEIALNNYRRDKDIIPGLISIGGSEDGKGDVVIERVHQLSQELQEAHLYSISLGTQVALIDQGHANTLSDVIESSLIQNLRGQLDQLQTQYSSMGSELKPNYPPMQELQVKINRIESLIREEIGNVAASIKLRYSAALNKEQALQLELDNEKKTALGLNDAAVRYKILEREADTNRQLYDAVLKRMKDVSVTADAHTSNVSIVDPAVAPKAPSSPRERIDVLFAATLGLMLGIGAVFVLEQLDNTFKTSGEAQKYLRLPSLGVIPKWRGIADHPGAGPKLVRFDQEESHSADLARQGDYSLAREAYRSMRAALLLSRPGESTTSIVITSANAAEGKTVTAVNTAIVLAHMSSKVLLIDADLRGPTCHKYLSIKNHRGLTELLAGTSEMKGLVHDTHVPGMFLLSSGKIPPNSAELLASKRMRQLLQELAAQYDFIVIDAPPLLPVSDALLLGSLADGVVVVVDASVTPKPQVREAVARLRHARVKIFGTLLNKVPLKGSPYSHYANERYYQRRWQTEDEAEIAGAEALEDTASHPAD
jgi:capsular exopolysaccharide synthesis family protein